MQYIYSIYAIALLIDFCAASISPCERTQVHPLGHTSLLTNHKIGITIPRLTCASKSLELQETFN